MLTIKANSKNIKAINKKIGDVSIVGVFIDADEKITYKFKCEDHKIQNGSTLIFDRKDGDVISYQEKYACTVIDKDTFKITAPLKYQLFPSEYEEKNIIKPILSGSNIPSTGETKTYGCLKFSDKKHIFEINRDDVKIFDYYVWNDDEEKYEHNDRITPCTDDYLLFDEVYLWQAPKLLNIENKVISAVTIGDSGVTTTLNVNTVPITIDGHDNTSELLLDVDGNLSLTDENLFEYEYYCDDTRFFTKKNGAYVINDGVSVYVETGNLKLTFSVGEDFCIDTFKDDFYRNNYVQNEIDSRINPIVNYERYPYEPMFYDGVITTDSGSTKCDWLKEHPSSADTHCRDVNKIVFNLNFRRKKFIEYKDPITERVTYRDFGGWETDENECWNNYILNDGGTQLIGRSQYIGGQNASDLLGWLGFTDEDVYYQKSALKKSFLRLSFYNSPNRETQKLLFYSTIYFDSNSKFGTYIKALKYSNSGNTDPAGLVFSDAIVSETGEKLQINASLFCTNKYDESVSSDGFYIHLFDKTTDGNQFSEIYMKAEFNNAKTGKIIPLICPLNGTGTPIEATNPNFPFNYLSTYNETIGSQTYSGISNVDMEKLLSDMYIKILVKYNYEKNKYMWILPTSKNNYNNETLTFTLFEPRLYGFNKDYKA